MNPTSETELSDAQIKALAIQGLLGTNTDQRNGALADLNSAQHRLQQTKNKKDAQYYALMGRLVKYEPDKVFSEVLQYAFDEGLFYKTQSERLDVVSNIRDYTTVNGKKTYKAHFTQYGHFLKKCEKDDELPIGYIGNFLMKNYKDFFVVDRSKPEYSKMEDFIKVIDAEEEILVIPTKNGLVFKDANVITDDIRTTHSNKTNKELFAICVEKGLKVNKSYKKDDLLNALVANAFVAKK
jgi:hypothetical protein